MWVDRAGVEHLAGAVHDRDLDSGAEAGVKAQGGAAARRRGQQQILEVAREHPDRVLLGALAQLEPGVDGCGEHELGAPGDADGAGQPGRRRGFGGQVHAE
ncbi:Uncharacterised protein [Mycobacteroides abscessus subsp. massiliense]|nr:Uncharacterised protein [Mycobacteroides abscessus subsp. massiliense]